jgi:hypothetical protein|tara:strand:+ start:182 stop:577 length:396 start_codon:yes stop_codon:yes gene_type:complete
MFAALIGPVLKGVFGIVDKVVEDKDLANKIKDAISTRQHDLESTELKGAISIILAEAQGSWLQRNWRPLLMLIVILIVANNYLVFPYLELVFPDTIKMLELPDKLWNLLMIGVGGYVTGRSGEKMIKTWKE